MLIVSNNGGDGLCTPTSGLAAKVSVHWQTFVYYVNVCFQNAQTKCFQKSGCLRLIEVARLHALQNHIHSLNIKEGYVLVVLGIDAGILSAITPRTRSERDTNFVNQVRAVLVLFRLHVSRHVECFSRALVHIISSWLSVLRVFGRIEIFLEFLITIPT